MTVHINSHGETLGLSLPWLARIAYQLNHTKSGPGVIEDALATSIQHEDSPKQSSLQSDYSIQSQDVRIHKRLCRPV